MIKYSLICAEKHRFDSWFASAAGFDSLKAAGMVSCAVCGSTSVEKAIMAPSVRSGEPAAEPAATPQHPLSEPSSPVERALAELRRHVEATSDYVGGDFARMAREMHNGEAPERAIRGEADLQQARSLLEDGVPITPLPFMTSRRTS
ncbi:DUF1178 family protein [Tropicimonas sp. IMCC34043]|uniref:DUF1178 family protein n=1 Tax=Tropicimonas sp. IMCC34043 TaxID=2248760 RepID=UPI000E25A2B5|nr:DUF1178 family protein [Tropicimonas sp. IMCC34043]